MHIYNDPKNAMIRALYKSVRCDSKKCFVKDRKNKQLKAPRAMQVKLCACDITTQKMKENEKVGPQAVPLGYDVVLSSKIRNRTLPHRQIARRRFLIQVLREGPCRSQGR